MLFCITADYTPQALNAMRENPTTNRREAVERLLEAAGGKVMPCMAQSAMVPAPC
jgi:uncharacterized protein with GYD domain